VKILVLLLFASFFLTTAVAVTHAWVLDSALGGGPRSMLHRPGWFLAAALIAGGLLVPLDLFLAFGGRLVAPAALSLALMLNVAAAGGLTALHELLGTLAHRVTRATAANAPVRLGVLGWVGPLVALVALGALVALDPGHDGRGPGPVSEVWAFYAVLSCAISAYALLRRRADEAAGPQEG
jgi:hypothetical protein